jgi:glycosyltransferase involved in cell wall biosynthesis
VSGSLVLYAPNVHTGGGIVLLHDLLAAWPTDQPLRALLDARARAQIVLPPHAQVSWVRASVGSRLNAERHMRRISQAGDTVLCFHGLPPLLPSAARVVVFQQNRNYLGLTPLSAFAWRTALRLAFERTASRLFKGRVALYIVQTPTMARELTRWLGGPAPQPAASAVAVQAFVDVLPAQACLRRQPMATWDFVYVSDGEAHKNHRRLFEAWQLLASTGLRPRLALTLGERDQGLAREAALLHERAGLQIHNLGHLPRDQVLALYGQARALIFPSTSESFGLPLVEAHQLGLPVLAPERDYVRDVCIPVETFDPDSATSIARAVRRFLGQSDNPHPIGSAAQFLACVRAGAAPGDNRAPAA